jgi:hypothetical protein
MRSKFLLFAVAFGAMSIAGAANATTITAYPGITCHEYQGTAGSYYPFYGTVMNQSSSGDLVVVCPFEKVGSYIEFATMRVWDRHPSLDVNCIMRTEYVSGSSLFLSSDSESSSGYGSSSQDVNFGSVSGGDYYYAFCTIPRTSSGANSHVINFWVWDHT